MDFSRVLITGGAGFVGSNLATKLAEAYEHLHITALDNLVRRGSELAVPRLRAAGVAFRHGDIRTMEDLESCGAFDLLIDCSAEPSVHAGTSGSPLGVLNTNLQGTIHCAEIARRNDAAILFLSTSRVYPIKALNDLPFDESETRFEWRYPSSRDDLTERGVKESFPLQGARSYYGASKLAAELVLTEFHATHGVPVLINRCGVLAGPWQMGKVDQGVVTLWVARHLFGRALKYIGFGGTGKQVRDVLHIDDLFDLVVKQLGDTEEWDATPFNVGGGRTVSISLAELTEICHDVTGRSIDIGAEPATNDVDIRIYLSDCTRAEQAFGWAVTRDARTIVQDTARWITDHMDLLKPIFSS